MPLDGVLYTLAAYLPCFNCTEVRLVDEVYVAELTEDVRGALAVGPFPDPTCPVCGLSLRSDQPVLFFSMGPPLRVLFASPTEQLDSKIAGFLLRVLRERLPGWPQEDPAELLVVPREDLNATQLVRAILPWRAPRPPRRRPPDAPGAARSRRRSARGAGGRTGTRRPPVAGGRRSARARCSGRCARLPARSRRRRAGRARPQRVRRQL